MRSSTSHSSPTSETTSSPFCLSPPLRSIRTLSTFSLSYRMSRSSSISFLASTADGPSPHLSPIGQVVHQPCINDKQLIVPLTHPPYFWHLDDKTHMSSWPYDMCHKITTPVMGVGAFEKLIFQRNYADIRWSFLLSIVLNLVNPFVPHRWLAVQSLHRWGCCHATV